MHRQTLMRCFNASCKRIRNDGNYNITLNAETKPITMSRKGECGHSFQNYIRFFSTKQEPRSKSKPFPVINAAVVKDSSEAMKNAASFKVYEDMYSEAKAIALAGGGEKSMLRHRKHGKMMVTERVQALVDDMEDFLELSLIAGIGMPYGHVPRANYLIGK